MTRNYDMIEPFIGWGRSKYLPFSNKLSESSIILFPEFAKVLAISRAASNRLSSRKPLFWRIASPTSSALFASPWARTIMDCEIVRQELQARCLKTHLFFLDSLVHQKRSAECSLLGHLWNVRLAFLLCLCISQTCLASTACVNSGEKATCVMETSSSTILNLKARCVRFSRTSRDTFIYISYSKDRRLHELTCSRCVINWLALNCATTLFSTSLTIEGRTRSS